MKPRGSLTAADVTSELKEAVCAYLLTRAYYETLDEQVKALGRQILAEAPLKTAAKNRLHGKGELITEPDLVYTADLDSPEVAEYYAELNKRERTEGIKPEDMPDEHCPALVARGLVSDAEALIINAAARMLGVDTDTRSFRRKLLMNGPVVYRKYIDLCCQLVVSCPDFVNPLERINVFDDLVQVMKKKKF